MVAENGIAREFIQDLTFEALKKVVRRNAEWGGSSGVPVIRFGVEREDALGSVEDIVDVVHKYEARLISLRTFRRMDSSERVCIYVTASDVDGKLAELQADLRGLGEVIYFKPTKQGSV